MNELPTVLSSLIAQYVIDDINAIEVLLSENIMICNHLPLVLKEVFAMPTIPNASISLNYFDVLWRLFPKADNTDKKYCRAADFGALHLLPYISTNPTKQLLLRAMMPAMEREEMSLLNDLMQIFFANNPSFKESSLVFVYPGKHGIINTLKEMIKIMSTRYDIAVLNQMLAIALDALEEIRSDVMSDIYYGDFRAMMIDKSIEFLRKVVL